MCGIGGFFTFQGHQQQGARQRLQQMTDALVHRGPDAEGFWLDNHMALGHRRLSIIDLSQGRQPMSTQDDRFHIIFNGEIYNYHEIRRELLDAGVETRTNSDTEALLLAYQQWGSGCLARLNGMFAFAIWDSEQQGLFLARDRVGKKPLYYCYTESGLAFASELKALLSAGLIPGKIDYEALDCYFSFGYIPAPMTIFRGVKKLEAAHFLEVSAKGMVKDRYWSLSFNTSVPMDEQEADAEFERLLDQAVSCRLMSEVPLGAFLSGGLDSTLVVSSMARALSQPVLTNSIGFGERDQNELPLAKEVARYLKTDHSEFVVQPQIREVLEKISTIFDEPFADSSAVPTWYVCQMARKNVTVALSGDGGDENFGGYTFRYLPHLFESRLRGCLPGLLRKMLFTPLGALYPASARLPRYLRLKTILENMGCSDSRAFYHDLVWLRPDLRKRLYRPEFMTALDLYTPYEQVRPLYESNHARTPLGRSLYTDINLYMTDNCLVKVDRMSMAHSLEVRSPLLDFRLMEFAATLPERLKISGGKGKVIFRRLAAKRLPKTVLNQPKKGFTVPAAQWLRTDLRPMLEETLFHKDSFVTTLLNRDELKKVWMQHQRGDRDHNVFLWGAMMLDLWARQFKPE